MKHFVYATLVLFMMTGGAGFITPPADTGMSVLHAEETEQKMCPVLGNPIDKSVYVDYQGKRIYFCCAGCIPEFKKNPDKYMEKLQGKKLPDSPKS